MKRFALSAAVVSLIALPAWGQTLKLPAPKQTESRSRSRSKPLPQVKDIRPLYRRLTKRSRLDARECLKYKTNEKVIVCAEKFL